MLHKLITIDGIDFEVILNATLGGGTITIRPINGTGDEVTLMTTSREFYEIRNVLFGKVAFSYNPYQE